MALSRSLLALFLVLVFALQLAHSVHVDSGTVSTGGRGLLQEHIDCRPACDARCARSWKLNMCKKMCAVCCSKCNCVPPGTSVEARATCPCYANMKNPKGQYKCP